MWGCVTAVHKRLAGVLLSNAIRQVVATVASENLASDGSSCDIESKKNSWHVYKARLDEANRETCFKSPFSEQAAVDGIQRTRE